MPTPNKPPYDQGVGNWKFGPEIREKYLDCIRRGMRLGASARAVGIDPGTVADYRKRHPEFQALIDACELEACEVVEDALMSKIVDGQSFPAMKYWLENRAQVRWNDIPAKIRNEFESADKKVMQDILNRLAGQEKEDKTPTTTEDVLLNENQGLLE